MKGVFTFLIFDLDKLILILFDISLALKFSLKSESGFISLILLILTLFFSFLYFFSYIFFNILRFALLILEDDELLFKDIYFLLL